MKNEDLDLLELQELALKNKSIKRHKSLDEKLMIVKAHLLNHVPISQLSADFHVNRLTIRRWISTFAPQTLNMIERLSVEPIQQKQGLKENCSTSVRDKNLGTQ